MNKALLETNSEIINLESLKARFLGNADLLDQVLRTFAETLDADLKLLEQAIRTDNSESAAFCAHRIKGMAASVEARELWKIASITENCAKNKSLDKLSGCLSQLHSQWEILVDVLRLEGCAVS
jgi:HPt (histidine-containing phosphotransfer) domain-containing protein